MPRWFHLDRMDAYEYSLGASRRGRLGNVIRPSIPVFCFVFCVFCLYEKASYYLLLVFVGLSSDKISCHGLFLSCRILHVGVSFPFFFFFGEIFEIRGGVGGRSM